MDKCAVFVANYRGLDRYYNFIFAGRKISREEYFAGGKFREIPFAVDIIIAGGKFRAKSKFANIAKISSTRKIGVIQYSSTTNRGHHLQLQQHHCRINSYQHSFFPSVVNLWNQLPSDTVGAASLNLFQNRLASLTLR